MATLNKILVASDMFVEANSRYASAMRDIDYATSILLSGAVVGIVGALLKDQGGQTSHDLLARIANLIREPGDDIARDGLFRSVYNSLKHAGDPRQGIRASDDLKIHTDLRLEAARMLDAAKADFREIEISEDVRLQLSPEFIQLLSEDGTYA